MVQTAGPYRRPLALLLVAAVGWIVFGVIRSQLPAGNGLAARYYANTTFADGPVESGYDPLPSTARMAERWQGRPPQAFGVVWTGYLTVPGADDYRFATTSDDGSRLFVDDRLVVDNSGPHRSETKSGTISLARGSHRVRLEYTQFGGSSELTWSWARGAATLAPVPAWTLSRRAVGSATVVLGRGLEIARWLLVIVGAAGAAWLVWLALPRVAPAKMARQAAAAYGGVPSLAFSACILIGFLVMPWPDGRGLPFYRTVELTLVDLGRSLRGALQDPHAFQANLAIPLAGEENAGPAAQQAVNMLRARRVDRYQLSDAIAANDWVYEQIVASAWPRKREADARVRVGLNTESTTGCELLSRDRDVSLVYCP